MQLNFIFLEALLYGVLALIDICFLVQYSLQTRTRKVLSEEKLEKLFEATKIILVRTFHLFSLHSLDHIAEQYAPIQFF